MTLGLLILVLSLFVDGWPWQMWVLIAFAIVELAIECLAVIDP